MASLNDYSKAQATKKVAQLPKGFDPPFEWDGNKGAVGVVLKENEAPPDQALWDLIQSQWGLDPETTEIVGPVNIRGWQAHVGDGEVVWMRYYRVNIRRRTTGPDAVDVDGLIKWIEKRKPVNKVDAPLDAECALVVALSDFQMGKGEGGGSKGIIDRAFQAMSELKAHIAYLKKVGRVPSAIYLIGMGDLVEQCSGHYCVEADTPILTADMQWVAAGGLEAGDRIYSCTEDYQSKRGRRYAHGQVLANKLELMDAVEVRFSDGGSLVCTPEHPLLSSLHGPHARKSRWVPAENLRVGDRIAKFSEPWEVGNTYDHGWLGGLFDGEGYLSAGLTRSAPNILGLSQLPGDVLDRARELLSQFGFKFTETENDQSGVHTLKHLGGYPSLLRCIGLVQPQRLINKIGEPYMRSSWVEVTSVTSIGKRMMARLGTSTHTYFANGYVSHNSMQAFQADLTRRDQMNIVSRLILQFVELLIPFELPIVLGAVPGNHGENRKDGKAYTDWSDNDDLAVFDAVRLVCESNPEHYANVYFPQGSISDDLTMTMDIAGVPVGFAHGHQCNRPTAVEKWWADQAMGNQPVGVAQLLFTGHFHFFSVSETTGRSWFQCPSLDGGSAWYTAKRGANSPPGVLVVGVGSAYGKRGWGDLALLGQGESNGEQEAS